MLTTPEKRMLYQYLIASGWTWSDGLWVAPYGSLRLADDEPWQGDLLDFLTRMAFRLSNLTAFATEDASMGGAVHDTASLVHALRAVAQPA